MWRQAVARSPGRAWARGFQVAAAMRSGEQVTVHHVKIKQRKGPVSKAAAYGIVAGVCYYVWEYIAYAPARHPAQGQPPAKNLDPRASPTQGDDEETEPWFLPFPFTDQQVQPLPYAGVEEEWQGFIKFNNDEKLRQRVKDDLSLMVKRAAENNPFTQKWAKPGEGFRLGHTWLIVSFPERPPPEFVRWGLEWNDEGLFLKTQKVDARTKALLDRVLMPYPVASASYAFAKAMVKQNVSKVARYFGYAPGGKELNTSSPDPEIEKTLKKLEARQTANGGTASSSSTTAASTPAAAEADSGARTPRKTAASATPGAKKDSDNPTVKDAIPYYATLVDKGSGPWAAFRDRYKRTWKPLRCYPPRGSLAVHGMVALDSPKGRVFIDVFAWYHPKTGQFHKDSLTMNLRSISPYDQRPRR